jgi:hypothetical protein
MTSSDCLAKYPSHHAWEEVLLKIFAQLLDKLSGLKCNESHYLSNGIGQSFIHVLLSV